MFNLNNHPFGCKHYMYIIILTYFIYILTLLLYNLSLLKLIKTPGEHN